MPRFKDLTYTTWDKLFVYALADKTTRGYRWWCYCFGSCGGTFLSYPLQVTSLTTGNTHSCGCERKRKNSERSFKHGESGNGDPKKRTVTYSRWIKMIARCTNPNDIGWKDYGGREPNPVTVCHTWRYNYLKFKEDMGGPCPEGYEMDRIDNDGGYWCGRPECPDCGPLNRKLNCRWVPAEENGRNKKGVTLYPFRGRMLTAGQISDAVGGTPSSMCLHYRLKEKKMDPEEAVAMPVSERHATAGRK